MLERLANILADFSGRRYALHLIPSGILNKNAMCVVGNGVVVHLPGMFEEIDKLQAKGVSVDRSRLLLSDRAHLLFDLHKEVDGMREAELAGKMIGTTKRGIGERGGLLPHVTSNICINGCACDSCSAPTTA